MNTATKITLLALAGCCVGFAASCTVILGPFDSDPSQCWCGEQWSSQISGATAFSIQGEQVEILASNTTYTRCVSMLEHLALDAAAPQDAVYMALHDAFESEAIAKCELAGADAWPNLFDHTDCAMTGTGSVTTNLSYLGPCWEWEDLEAEPSKTCPLEEVCGDFYDCSEDPIILYHGHLQTEGETEGSIPWTGNEELWSCDEPPVSHIEGPGDISL